MSKFFKTLHMFFSEPLVLVIIIFFYLPQLSDILFQLRAEVSLSYEYTYNSLGNLFKLILIITSCTYFLFILFCPGKYIELRNKLKDENN